MFDWAAFSGIAVAGVVVGTAVLGKAKWVFDHEIRDQVRQTQAEFRPNGGESFRDHVDQKLDAIARRFHERINETQQMVEAQAKINRAVDHRLENIERQLDDFDRRRRSQERPRWFGGST